MKTKTDRSFYQYVFNTLSAADFKRLPQMLKLSRRMTTMRLNTPTKLDYRTIKKLVPILGGELKNLVEQYELGYDALTAREYKQLMS